MLILLILIACFVFFKVHKYNKSDYKKKTNNGFFNVIFNKGNYGEYLTFNILEEVSGYKKILPNVYMIDSDKNTTEIDLVMIHETGIYVFESKNYSSWIFGNEKDTYWMQTFANRQKYKFFNPIWQNKKHIKCLNSLFKSLPEECFKSYIVFSERCELKKITYDDNFCKVLKREHLYKVLMEDIKVSSKVFSEDKVDEIYRMMELYCNVDDETKKDHIKAIKK